MSVELGRTAGVSSERVDLFIQFFISVCTQPWQLADSMCNAADPVNLQLMHPFLGKQELVQLQRGWVLVQMCILQTFIRASSLTMNTLA